jgi:hypothetical protein
MSGTQMDSNEKNQKLGAFVTNKWLVGTLMLLIMGMGSYIFKGIDKGTEAQAMQIDVLQSKAQALEIDLASQKVTILLQYTEIIRRLDRMESQLYINRRTAP